MCDYVAACQSLRWGKPPDTPKTEFTHREEMKMAEKDRMRKKKIQIFLSDEEYAGLVKLVEACNMNISSYVRKVIFESLIIYHEPFDIKELANELNHIGVNINQIAKSINERGGEYDIQDMEAIRHEFQNMQDCIYNMIWGDRK